jgi:hypothetical protein
MFIKIPAVGLEDTVAHVHAPVALVNYDMMWYALTVTDLTRQFVIQLGHLNTCN